MQLTLAGGAYEHISIDVNNQRCVNMFPISAGPEGRGGACLIPTAGLTLLTDLGSGEIRQMKVVRDDIYVVSGNTVYKLNFNPETLEIAPASIGSLNTSSGPVSMATNPTQIIFVDGTDTGYLYNLDTEVFAEISDGDFPACTKVVFVDGYFMVNNVVIDGGTGEVSGNGKFYVSALNNGNSWDPLDVGTAESDTDSLVVIGLAKGEPWLLGTNSVEIWYNAANETGTPFSVRRGLTMRIGCIAPQSAVEIDDRLMWLDSRGYIVQTGLAPYVRDNNTGYQLDIVSTDAMTTEILDYPRLDDALAMTYNDRGHLMYQITFPSARKTWVYDLTTKQWHERTFYNSNANELQEHLAQFAVQLNNRTVMGGQRNGKIYLADHTVYTDNGAIIRRIRTLPPQNMEFKLVGIDCLEIRMETGSVPASGDGSNANIGLRYSHDGGHTWSFHLNRSIGQIGEYAKSIRWNRLGSGREWVFEFTISDALPFTIMDAAIDIEEVEN